MTDKILLKPSPKDKPVVVTPHVHLKGKHGYILLGPAQIGGQAVQLANMLRRLADQLEPVIQHSAFNRVLTITPNEVIAHFENSPVLQEMASDVRSVLENANLGQINASPSQLEQDLERVFDAGLNANATKADIAQVLTGKRGWGGDVMKKRLDDIQNLLTTAKNGSYQTTDAKQAA